MRVENQTKTQVWEEDSSLCPETLAKNADQEFHLRTEQQKKVDGNAYHRQRTFWTG